MHISKLPEDILRLVLSKFVNRNRSKAEIWKHSLTILAVCRNWRELAEPHVYSSLYLLDATSMCSKSPVLVSNLDLIRVNNKLSYVRNLKIELWYTASTSEFIAHVLQALDPAANMWAQVISLEIMLYSQDYVSFTYNSDFATISNTEASPAYFAKVITQSIPNVNKLRVDGNRSAACVLARKLFGSYSRQLKSVSSNVSIPYSVAAFSDELSFLKIRAGLLTISNSVCSFTKSLRHMELEDIEYNFSWLIFDSKATQNPIPFSSLVYLSLSFSPEITADTHHMLIPTYLENQQRPKARFYKLQHLKVSLQPKHSILLSECMLPSYIEHIEVVGTAWPKNFLQNAKVTSVGKLDASFSTDDFNITEKLCLSNYLFGKLCIAKATSLCLNHTLTTLQANQVDWENLAELNILKHIDVRIMLDLLTRATNITALTIACVDLDLGRLQSADDYVSELQRMPCLSKSKLQILRIKQFQTNVLPETASLVADCLVGLLSSLQTIIYPTCGRIIRRLQ